MTVSGHLSYTDVLRKGLRVGNHNLAALLTQFVAAVLIGLVLLVFQVVFILVAVASLPDLDIKDLSLDSLQTLFKMSVTLLAAGGSLGLVFLAVVALVVSYVNAGNLGCIINTVKGAEGGFRAATFYATGRRAMLPMLGMLLLWGAFALGITVILGAFADVGLYKVLLPMKEGGHRMTAFAIWVPFLMMLFVANLVANYTFIAGWSFSSIILVDEGRGISMALDVAYAFIKKNFWDSLLFVLMLLTAVFVVVAVVNVLAVIVLFPLNIADDTNTAVILGSLPIVLFNLALLTYLGLVATSCLAVYYFSHTAPPHPPEAPAEGLPLS